MAGLQIGGTLSYNDLTQDADVTQNGILLYGKGDRLGFSPEYTATAFLDYEFSLGDRLEARFKFADDCVPCQTGREGRRAISVALPLSASGDLIDRKIDDIDGEIHD